MIDEVGPAATKLRPPMLPRRLVARSRLDDMLDAAVDDGARLVLVCAPPGSGKSTLVASWTAARAARVAWLQVEERDADPARFWSYLIQAVVVTGVPAMADLTSAATGSRGDDGVVVSALVNALAAQLEPLILVVDDYHLIDNDTIHTGMERLIDLCPPHVTLLVATRTDPPFRLSRLRVRHQLAELRAADLRFGADEAADLLATPMRPLDPGHADVLCERTEGWAAGLVLAGLTLERSTDRAAFVEAFRGDDRLVVEYLHDELIATLSDGDRRIFLETSVLDQMTGGLVDAVAGGSGGTSWLRDTARANQLVVALDDTGTWFRYHHLLRDLLRIEAQRLQPDRVTELHARAAAWFERHGDRGQAIVHWLAAGAPDEVIELLSVHGPRLLAEGQSDTLRGILDQLGDLTRTAPWPALLRGWCAFLDGRYDESDRWLDTMIDVAPEGFDLGFALAPRMNNALARGDVASALRTARAAAESGELVSHSSTRAAAAGAAFAWAGLTDDARGSLRRAVEKATVERAGAVRVNALVSLAIVELEAGTPAAAHAAADTAIAAAEQLGLPGYHSIAPAYAIRARSGGSDPMADARHAVDLARRASTPLVLGHVLAIVGDTLLERGDPTGERLVTEAREIIAGLSDPGIAGGYLARVQARHGIETRSRSLDGATVEQLTDRELAVLRYLSSNLSQRDIAAELFVSLNTVKTHCRAIYRKLGVTDRKAAVHAARDLIKE